MTQQKWDSADLIFNIHHKEEKSAACKMSCRAAHRYIVVQSREWKVQSARLEWCSHSKWNGAVSQTGKCGQATGTVQSDMWNLQRILLASNSSGMIFAFSASPHEKGVRSGENI